MVSVTVHEAPTYRHLRYPNIATDVHDFEWVTIPLLYGHYLRSSALSKWTQFTGARKHGSESAMRVVQAHTSPLNDTVLQWRRIG